MPVAVFLDESRRERHHPILSVGGFVCDLSGLTRLESRVDEREGGLGIRPTSRPLRGYLAGPGCPAPLIEQIPALRVRLSAVAALLEDFRPQHLKGKEAKEGDA